MSVTCEYAAAPTNVNLKLYKRRWIMMAIFVLYGMNGGIQWLQYSIITDIVSEYYNVSKTLVEWTTISFMLAYVLLSVPSIFLLDKLGIRCVMIIASTGICIGSWIKVLSVNPDRFYLVLLGQVFQAVFQVTTFALAARFTAVWFGADEIAIAGTFALFGDQFGTALGFKIPTVMVTGSPIKEVTAAGLMRMNLTVACLSTFIAITSIIFFQAEPRIPPSIAQVKQNEVIRKEFWQNMRRILKTKSFLLLLLSYGCTNGPFNSVSTLMNQIMLDNFPEHGREIAGNIGFVMFCCGIACSILLGYILDRNKLFKETAVFLSGFSLVGMVLFTISLKLNNVVYVYAAGILMGMSNVCYFIMAVQLAIELTYPIPEGFSSTLMLLSVQLHGVIITPIQSYFLKQYGDLISNIVLCFILFLSLVFVSMLPSNMKRQTVEKVGTIEDDKEFYEK